MGIPLCCNICTFVPMNEEQKISVVINTYNAEKHLRKVLDSLKDFDEVLICDMESTDSTLSIASLSLQENTLYMRLNIRGC